MVQQTSFKPPVPLPPPSFSVNMSSAAGLSEQELFTRLELLALMAGLRPRPSTKAQTNDQREIISGIPAQPKQNKLIFLLLLLLCAEF